MIDIGVIPKLTLLLKRNTGRPVVRKSAVQVFANMTHGGSMEQIKHLVDQGCIAPLLDLLLGKDTENVINVLKTLYNVS